MRVEAHDAFRNLKNFQATRVVVYDEYDNPIAVVVQLDSGQYMAATATNPKFNDLLKLVGLHKTIVVDHINTNKLTPLPVD